jgi:DNA-binding LacI/PurR family transcriptional regulator
MSDKDLPVRPTVKTLAALAKVSVSTVSRSLSDDPSISKTTKRRIIALAKRVGFVPNVAARGLAQRSTSLVGFVIGPFTNPFYLEMLPILASRLTERGAQLMVFRVKDASAFESTLAALAQYQVKGCLIAAASFTLEAAQICTRFRIPVVMINRLADLYASSVNCNNREAGEQVAALLYEEGRRHLIYVGGHESEATAQDRDREQGFRSKALALGAVVGTRYAGEYTYEGGGKAAEAILRDDPKVEGIFVANDIMAFGVLDRLRRAGISVPKRLSVVGFDDLSASSWNAYDLSTVRQPVEAMIDRAYDLLVAHAEDPYLPAESSFLRGTLVRRGTTRTPKASPR